MPELAFEIAAYAHAERSCSVLRGFFRSIVFGINDSPLHRLKAHLPRLQSYAPRIGGTKDELHLERLQFIIKELFARHFPPPLRAYDVGFEAEVLSATKSEQTIQSMLCRAHDRLAAIDGSYEKGRLAHLCELAGDLLAWRSLPSEEAAENIGALMCSLIKLHYEMPATDPVLIFKTLDGVFAIDGGRHG